jgi:DNA helicase MCM8
VCVIEFSHRVKFLFSLKNWCSFPQAKRFLTVLHKRAESLSRSLFDFSEMKDIAKLAQVDVSNFSSFITTLNNQGYLLKKGHSKYQLLSAD